MKFIFTEYLHNRNSIRPLQNNPPAGSFGQGRNQIGTHFEEFECLVAARSVVNIHAGFRVGPAAGAGHRVDGALPRHELNTLRVWMFRCVETFEIQQVTLLVHLQKKIAHRTRRPFVNTNKKKKKRFERFPPRL